MVAFIDLLPAILAIVIGLIILVWPKILNIAIAVYLLAIGVLKLLIALGVFAIAVPIL